MGSMFGIETWLMLASWLLVIAAFGAGVAVGSIPRSDRNHHYTESDIVDSYNRGVQSVLDAPLLGNSDPPVSEPAPVNKDLDHR